MKIQIIHTRPQIYRGQVRQWIGGFNGGWEYLRRATSKDRKTIITVR